MLQRFFLPLDMYIFKVSFDFTGGVIPFIQVETVQAAMLQFSPEPDSELLMSTRPVSQQ